MKRIIFITAMSVLMLLASCCKVENDTLSDAVTLSGNDTHTTLASASKASGFSSSENSEPVIKNKRVECAEKSSKNKAGNDFNDDTNNSKVKSPVCSSATQNAVCNQNNSEQFADESDKILIADAIIKYINGYRNANGACTAKKLPRLTEYAEYRSRQLTQHFAHDTVDERAAETAIKYGDYFDPTDHGLPGEPYYIAHANEAIAWSDMQGTEGEIAKDVACSAVDSSAHWSYVGDNQFGYIGVGVTFYEGKWYVSIVVSETDKFD